MIKKLYYLTFAFVILTVSAFAQGGSGELKGTVTDKATKQPIPFASVVVYSSGNQVAGTQTDFDGNYKIKPISPGKYDVKAAILGYAPIQLTGVIVYSDKISFANITMGATIETLTAVEKVDYKVPVFEKDNTSTWMAVTSSFSFAAISFISSIYSVRLSTAVDLMPLRAKARACLP